MGLMQRLSDAFRGSSVAVQEKTANVLRVTPLCSNYDNLFAQVRPLVDEMKTVRPYGIGRNGAKLDANRTPELALLDSPNDQMGWVDFADTMFVMWLTEAELNIHVWKNKRGKIEGYTILPVGARKSLSGQEYFEVSLADGKTKRYEKDEVMTLRFSRDTHNLDAGMSPGVSTYVWAQIDDLIAQYQRAYFENGAVPATITIIRASTRERYENKRRDLEQGLKGAGNKNKTLYLWRQQLDDGSTADEVEVKPIQGNNSTLAIKDIKAIVNDELNKSIGVSNFILGDDSSAKYDNAELSDFQFTKRRVYPALLSFWSQFQHELDRITGGLGYAISFKIELPELTDRKKVQADTARINVESLTALINAGASPASAMKALGLADGWQGAANDIYASKVIAVAQSGSEEPTTDIKPEVVTVDEAKCEHHCDHSHGEAILDDYVPVWEPGEEYAKQIYDLLVRVAGEIAAENPNINLDQLKEDIATILKEAGNDGAVEGAEFLKGMVGGGKAAETLADIAANKKYELSATFTGKLEERTALLVDSFAGDTKAAVATVLANMAEQGATKGEIERALATVMPRGRAAVIARNEVHNAINGGRYELDQDMAAQYGLKIELVWDAHIDSRTCDVCAAMDGQVVAIGEAFPDQIETEDGKIVAYEQNEWNGYGKDPNAHVNCRCTFSERVSIAK